MMYLLPKPQIVKGENGFLNERMFCVYNSCKDSRIQTALQKLPCCEGGVPLEITDRDGDSEGYTLKIDTDKVSITGDSPAGVFYGIQTLRQLLNNDEIPCLTIKDFPGFVYRGVYHDVTRGKIPTVDTLKKLIDQLAYYKVNSLQLYVEHTFPFQEFGEYAEKNGYLTPEELMELDEYCFENFIEFIPSIATFGHLYELLQQKQYRKFQELENYEEDQLYWHQRMQHHTIDPVNEGSIEIIKSMLDQYMPLFRTDKFNICCDETFDLKNGKHKNQDTGRLYVDFVKKIIAHLESKEKKVMMWADILLQYPETIQELPKNLEFLNWNYDADPKEDAFRRFGELKCTQIVCPGTGSWSRLVEGIDAASRNILTLCEYGYQYKAKGVLNTNWGDFGNPCCLELSMHGLVLGAAKAWNRETDKNLYFDESIGHLLYKNGQALSHVTVLDEIQSKLDWNSLAYCYSNCIYEKKFDVRYPEAADIRQAQSLCQSILDDLENQKWDLDEYRKEIMIAAEGLMVMAELFAKHAGYQIESYVNLETWLEKFSEKWLEKNKPGELYRIQHMFHVLDKN